MEYLESSFFVTLLIRFWDYITVIFRGSILYRFCMWCWAAYKSSLFYRFAKGGEKAGAIWCESVLYRCLTWTLNLPARLSAWLFARENTAMSNSFVVNQALDFSERRCVPFLGLIMLALLIIPQKSWNNMYSFVAVVLAVLLFIAACARTKMRFELREIGFFPVMFALCTVVSYITSQQMGLSLRFLVFAATCMMLVLVVVSAPRSSRDLRTIIALCSIGVFICSIYALYQRLVGVEVNGILTDITLNADMPGRVYSFFENPNSFANILVLFAPIMLAMALYAPGSWSKLWYLLVFAVSCMALLMTYARGGWLSLAVGLGIFMLTVGPRWVPLCILICVVALPFLPDSILNRLLTIFNSADSSIYTRVYIYSAMGRLVGMYPLFGVGLGASALKHAIEATGVYEAKALFVHAHNIYLQIWGEMGIFALIAFIGSMAFALRTGLGQRKNEDGVIRAVSVGASCALCASLFFGITDYAWSYPRVMVMFWFVFALIPAANRLKNNQEAGKING